MRRREFLKLVGLAGVASAVPLQALAGAAQAIGAKTGATAVAYHSALYAAGANGRILVSTDSGRTWTVHTNLGSACSVRSLAVRGNRLAAVIAFQGLGFPLYLGPDRKAWLTI